MNDKTSEQMDGDFSKEFNKQSAHSEGATILISQKFHYFPMPCVYLPMEIVEKLEHQPVNPWVLETFSEQNTIMKQDVDVDSAELDLKGLSIEEEETKFPVPLFTVSSDIKSHSKEKAVSDAGKSVDTARKLNKKKLKKQQQKQKMIMRAHIEKLNILKKKPDFIDDDEDNDKNC